MENVILQASLALLAAALTAWFAVHTYFRQREHELILSRYLEGSLDLLASEVSRVSEVFSHNWARSLAILKSYRDLEDQFDLDELQKGFIELQSSKHNVVDHHRLHTLTRTYVYWTANQHAMAYFTNANSVLVKEIPEAIRVRLCTDRVTTPHSDIVNGAFAYAKKQDDDCHEYVQLASEFQALSAALESEQYRFKTLHKFRKKQEVKESLQRVKALLASMENEDDAQRIRIDRAQPRSYPVVERARSGSATRSGNQAIEDLSALAYRVVVREGVVLLAASHHARGFRGYRSGLSP